MRVSYDPAKRDRTLIKRGLDFDDAVQVFVGVTVDAVDDRRDYGEQRWQTYGFLRERLVTVIWTNRDGDAM